MGSYFARVITKNGGDIVVIIKKLALKLLFIEHLAPGSLLIVLTYIF